jgi:HK97 family phage portal protein
MIPTMAAALRATVEAEEYAGRYFSESAIPTGVITDSRPDLSQDQANDLKAAWQRTVGGRRRVPIVLPASTTFTALVSDADKAQLVEARQWNAQTVAMALNIPPFLLGVGAVPHVYTNAENEFGRLIRTTINRLIVPLQQAISLQCLPGGNEAVFDPRPLLRPEASVRATMSVQLYAAKIITQEEARDLAGFPAEGGPGEAAADEPGFPIDPVTGAQVLPVQPVAVPAAQPAEPEDVPQ